MYFGRNFSNSNRMMYLKNLFLETRNTIYKLDRSIGFVLILDITDTMINIMMNIYAFALAENIPALKHYSQNIVYEGIASSLKLLISCVINGKVYEESHRIYLVLDNFNAQDLSEIEYKEWVMFKNIAKESFGFSIGGLAALRKTTLISVKKIIDKFIVFEKIFVPSGILIHIELYGNPIANKKMKYQLGKKFTNHETNENIYKLITILFIC